MHILREGILSAVIVVAALSAACYLSPQELGRRSIPAQLNRTLARLEAACDGKPVLAAGDLGAYFVYRPGERVKSLVEELAATDHAEWEIADRYCVPTSQIADHPIELVFPLLDVLLRIEHRIGGSTAEIREKLWASWTTRFAFEFGLFYSKNRHRYEDEIRLPR